jgi:hypothetical protein
MSHSPMTLQIQFLLSLSLKEEGWVPHTLYTHYPVDTHANLSRLIANLSWLIRKSAGNFPDEGL